MKIFLIYTNIGGLHSDCFSFGLASISSTAKAKGHDVRAAVIKTRDAYKSVLNDIAVHNPKIVGFTSVSSQFHFVKELAGLIKDRFPKIITVCGGVHPTIKPECVMEASFLDAVFVGESELAFATFLDRVNEGLSYRDVDNLAYCEGGKLIKNKLSPLIVDLDKLPYPDRDNPLFHETVKAVEYVPFFFSRGCPYLCSYCSNHAIAKAYGKVSNAPRYRSPESSIREIEEVINTYAVSKIAIGDDIFGINKEWRREFCEKYKERIKIRFFCLLRANIVDDEFAKLLKSAGCYSVSIGVESGNDFIRNEVMNRQLGREQIINAFTVLRKHKLQTISLNIIGVPGETKEMIWDTIKLNRIIRPTASAANIFYPYKGTKLGDRCFSEGIINKELYYNFSNERRESVINYSQEHKQMLVYMKENWQHLIYRYDFIHRLEGALRFFLGKIGILNFLIKLKRICLTYVYRGRRVKVK